MPSCAACGAELSPSARFCERCGRPLHGQAGARERKLVTIVFADLTGSTGLGERLDPERLRTILDDYFARMAAVIGSWGGTVEKYIGDAILAVFGVPTVREDDAARALYATLEMLGALEALNVELHSRHGVRLAVRIGINTGEVVAPVGADEQIMVTGDAVNSAARLEQAAEPNTILVGPRTYLATRDLFRFDTPTEMPLKGKAEPMTARRLLGALDAEATGVPGLQAPMVGRDRELATLMALLADAVESKRPRLALVYGPAGIGKSRLLRELIAAMPAEYPDARVLRGRCLPAGHGLTFWPLAEIVRSACAISLDEPADAAAEKLRTGLAPILAPLTLTDVDRDQTVFALAATAGIAIPDNPLDAADPQAVADELARAWPRFASALAVRGPAVLAIEDLHWADVELLQMLERMAGRSSGSVFLLATARPEFAQTHPEFAAGREDASAISLRPLTETQSGQLVDGLLEVADLPAELRSEILDKAEGNPFFLEQILRRLIDEGALVREGERWRAATDARHITLPDTIQALLAARIDTLPAQEKRTLQEASVVGRIFWEAPLSRAVGQPVSEALLALERRGLVLVRPESTMRGETEYLFKHALVRDVAYATLPKSRRARAHAEVATWLEEVGAGGGDELLELRAEHYAAAVVGEDVDLAWGDAPEAFAETRRRAFGAMMAAGTSARRRFALTKAISLHELAAGVGDSAGDVARAREELGDDHQAAFRGDEAVAAYVESLEKVRVGGDAEDVARLARKIAFMATRSGAFRETPDNDLVVGLVEEGLRLTGEAGTRGWLLAMKAAWAPFSAEDLSPQERADLLEQARGLGESAGDLKLQMEAGMLLGEMHELAGSPELALRDADRLLGIVPLLPARERAEVLCSVANDIVALEGDYSRALLHARAARLLADELLARELSPHLFMHTSFSLMVIQRELGQWDEVLGSLDAHLDAFGRHETNMTCTTVPGGLLIGAIVLAERGDTERAIQLAERAGWVRDRIEYPSAVNLTAEFLEAIGEVSLSRAILESVLTTWTGWQRRRGSSGFREAAAMRVLLDTLVAQGDLAAVTDQLPRARAVVKFLGDLGTVADRAEGLVKAAAGDADGAETLLGRALEDFDRRGLIFEAARTAEALAGVVNDSERDRLLARALETYRTLAARPHAQRVEQAMTAAPAR